MEEWGAGAGGWVSPVGLVKLFCSQLMGLPGRFPRGCVVTWGTGSQEMKGRAAQGSWVSQRGSDRRRGTWRGDTEGQETGVHGTSGAFHQAAGQLATSGCCKG